MSTNTGGPAFPSHGSMGEVSHEGMTLRDYFAGQALAGFSGSGAHGSPDQWAAVSWKIADAMLAAREAKQ
jgi:hypothetical protein